ncbi:MAG: MgtC/SapB family protein [Bacteroidetes bacterium]|nr:MgtC/SapB family protein [Bacteroidota bacterium]
MNINLDIEVAVRLLLSFAIGTSIGLEREYRSKAAGLRTMVMICLGSTIFTEISIHIGGGSADRIAANIVTGIGFLGGGVIFKDGLTITGITTATTIWISAALGMAVGSGEYFIAVVGSGVVLVVLTLMEKVQVIVERIHQSRTYRISFLQNSDFAASLEKSMDEMKLGYRKRREAKDAHSFVLIYEVFGRDKNLEQLTKFLKEDTRVISFGY